MKPTCETRMNDAASLMRVGLEDDGAKWLSALHVCSALSQCPEWRDCTSKTSRTWDREHQPAPWPRHTSAAH